MEATASGVEKIWTAVSLLASLLNAYLTWLAWQDWRAAVDAQGTEYQLEPERTKSAGWYAFSHLFLCLPQLIHLIIGAWSLLLPPPIVDALNDATGVLQSSLLSAEIMATIAAGGFWKARRLLEVLASRLRREHAELMALAAATHSHEPEVS